MMPVIYVAGAYRSDQGEWYVERNIRKAEALAVAIWAMGGVALCPHKNTARFGGAVGLEDSVWLAGDKVLLERCDAVATVPGWGHSEGACDEIELAHEIGKPVFSNLESLADFIYAQNANRWLWDNEREVKRLLETVANYGYSIIL